MILAIVAVDQKRGIAKQGVQPWSLPADEHYFNRMTTSRGGRILMGQTTYETIGHVLKGRENYVASRTHRESSGVHYVQDLSLLLESYTGEKDIWVIGGAAIYEQTISLVDELYITKIDADFMCDQFFPPYENKFELVGGSSLQHENGLTFSYRRYRKRIRP